MDLKENRREWGHSSVADSCFGPCRAPSSVANTAEGMGEQTRGKKETEDPLGHLQIVSHLSWESLRWLLHFPTATVGARTSSAMSIPHSGKETMTQRFYTNQLDFVQRLMTKSFEYLEIP